MFLFVIGIFYIAIVPATVFSALAASIFNRFMQWFRSGDNLNAMFWSAVIPLFLMFLIFGSLRTWILVWLPALSGGEYIAVLKYGRTSHRHDRSTNAGGPRHAVA